MNQIVQKLTTCPAWKATLPVTLDKRTFFLGSQRYLRQKQETQVTQRFKFMPLALQTKTRNGRQSNWCWNPKEMHRAVTECSRIYVPMQMKNFLGKYPTKKRNPWKRCVAPLSQGAGGMKWQRWQDQHFMPLNRLRIPAYTERSSALLPSNSATPWRLCWILGDSEPWWEHLSENFFNKRKFWKQTFRRNHSHMCTGKFVDCFQTIYLIK